MITFSIESVRIMSHILQQVNLSENVIIFKNDNNYERINGFTAIEETFDISGMWYTFAKGYKLKTASGEIDLIYDSKTEKYVHSSKQKSS